MKFDQKLLEQCEKLGITLDNSELPQIIEEETTFMVLDLAVFGMDVKMANKLFEEAKSQFGRARKGTSNDAK